MQSLGCGVRTVKEWSWSKIEAKRRMLPSVDVCLFQEIWTFVCFPSCCHTFKQLVLRTSYRSPSSTSRPDTMPGWYPGIAHQVRLKQCMGGPHALLSGTNVGRPCVSIVGQVLWCAALPRDKHSLPSFSAASLIDDAQSSSPIPLNVDRRMSSLRLCQFSHPFAVVTSELHPNLLRVPLYMPMAIPADRE